MHVDSWGWSVLGLSLQDFARTKLLVVYTQSIVIECSPEKPKKVLSLA